MDIALAGPVLADGSAARFDLHPAAGVALAAGAPVRLRGFPLPDGSRVDLRLAPFSVTAPGARFLAVASDGTRDAPAPAFHAWRGQAVGDPASRVVLGFHAGKLSGFIDGVEGRYRVGAASVPVGGAGSLEVRAADDHPDQPDGPLCVDAVPGLLEAEPKRGGLVSSRGGGVDGSTPLVATVAIDATYEWFDHFPSLDAAQAYILNVMAQVSAIYEDELNIRIEVPFLRVFTAPDDPYSNTTDTQMLLAELRAEWNANQTDVDRSVVHLFGKRPSGGSGIAYLDVLCNHQRFPGGSYDYGVSTMSAAGASWERKLVAHELGHNFSSPHTHCYEPAIDQCASEPGCYDGEPAQSTGTIMSYCNSTNPVFHGRVKAESIRPAAEAATALCVNVDSGGGAPLPPDGVRVN